MQSSTQNTQKMVKKTSTKYTMKALASALLLLSACGQPSHKAAPSDDYTAVKEQAMEYSESADMSESSSISASSIHASPMAEQSIEVERELNPNDIESQAFNNKTHLTADMQERQFIKTASAELKVKDVYKTSMTLEDMAVRHGGFVIHNRITNNREDSRITKIEGDSRTVVESYRPYGELVVRIPHDKIQVFLREMIKQTEFMYSRNFNAEDMLFEIIRQQKLAEVQNENSDEMADYVQKGDKLKDKLKVAEKRNQQKINAVHSEIEEMRIKDKIAYSTINLKLAQSIIVRTYTEPHFQYYVEQAQPTFEEELNANINHAWENSRSFVAGLILWTPVLVFFALFYLIFRVIYNRVVGKPKNDKNNSMAKNTTEHKTEHTAGDNPNSSVDNAHNSNNADVQKNTGNSASNTASDASSIDSTTSESSTEGTTTEETTTEETKSENVSDTENTDNDKENQ